MKYRVAAILGLCLVVSTLGSMPALAEPGGGEGDIRVSNLETVEYVQADSPQEAQKIFDQQNSDKSDGGGEKGQVRAAKKVYGPCNLEVQGVHMRKSGSWRTVGFKAYTRCTVKVTSIRHDNRLREKSGLYWNKVVPTSGSSNIAKKSKLLESKGIEFLCPSQKKNHWWSGNTRGTVIYKGKTYYAIQNAPVSAKALPCNA